MDSPVRFHFSLFACFWGDTPICSVGLFFTLCKGMIPHVLEEPYVVAGIELFQCILSRLD